MNNIIKRFFSSVFLEDFSNDELIMKNLQIVRESLYQTMLFSTNIIIINILLLSQNTYKNLYSYSNFPIIPISIVMLGIQLLQISIYLINTTNKDIKIDELKFQYIIIQVIITSIFILIIIQTIYQLIYTDIQFLDRTLLLQIFYGNQQFFIHSFKINCILICLIELMLISQTQLYLNKMTEIDGSYALVKHISQHFFNISILLITIIRQIVFHTIRNEQIERIQINQKTLHDVRNQLQSFQYFQQEQTEQTNQREIIHQVNEKIQSIDEVNKKDSYGNLNEVQKDQEDGNTQKLLKTENETINIDKETQNMNKINFKFIMQKCDQLYQLDLICEMKQNTKLIQIDVKSLLNSSVDILNVLFYNKHSGFQIILKSEINSILIDTNVFNYILAEIIENLFYQYDLQFSVELIFALIENCIKIKIQIPQLENVRDIFRSNILFRKLDCLADITFQNSQLDNEQNCLEIDIINKENYKNSKLSNQNQENKNNQVEKMNIFQNHSSKWNLINSKQKQNIEEYYFIGKNNSYDNKTNDLAFKQSKSLFNEFVNFESKDYSLEDQSEYLKDNQTEYFADGKQIFVNVDDEENILKMNYRLCSKHNITLNKFKDREAFMRLLGKLYNDSNKDLQLQNKVIVFMDHMLYRDLGQEVIKSANEFNKVIRLDITQILLSSTEDSCTLSKYKNQNVKHFVTKPLNVSKLQKILKDVGTSNQN